MHSKLAVWQLLFVLLIATVIYALRKQYLDKNSWIQVGRGKLAWKVFTGTFTVIFAAFVFTITNSSLSNNYKGILYILSALGVAYLCFDSGWFQNKVLGIYNHYTSKRRGHS